MAGVGDNDSNEDFVAVVAEMAVKVLIFFFFSFWGFLRLRVRGRI